MVNKKWRKIMLFLLVFLITGSAESVFGASYIGYNYSNDGRVKAAPIPYMPAKKIDGDQLDVGSFKSPEDFYITDDQKIYIADTGNHRIIVLDNEWNVLSIIDKFTNKGKVDGFNNPNGVFVNEGGNIFIADTENQRIVELGNDGKFIREIGEPSSEVLREAIKYTPTKITVDRAGRLYVVCKGVYDGLMTFSPDGEFTGFMGVNHVRFSATDLFWKQLATKEQKERMNLFIPVEFNNLDIDKDGFIYVTTADGNSKKPVRRLNPSGQDVLRAIGYFDPRGDVMITRSGSVQGPSTMVDVAADQHGIYSVLDAKRGRIFTYDKDGILMYIFGQLGERTGNFKVPVAIGMLGDQVVVLDKGFNQLTIYELTRYGTVVRNAVIYNDIGEEERSVEAWQEALKLNNNLDQAYIGIGKSQLYNKENGKAVESFKSGVHLESYSKAFARYRKEFVWDHFGMIVALLILSIVLIVASSKFIGARLSTEFGTFRSAWFVMLHPFEGFSDLKYEKKGKQWYTVLVILSLTIVATLKQIFSGFLVNPIGRNYISVIEQLGYIIIPFFLWCIANWSLTTLMDGEGKFKEIVMATGYALQPLFIVQIILIVLSRFIIWEEIPLYSLLASIAVLWCAWLLFTGMMTIHQYNVWKTIATMILTIVVIMIILFLGLLFFSLLQQMIGFSATIYQELLFRLWEG